MKINFIAMGVLATVLSSSIVFADATQPTSQPSDHTATSVDQTITGSGTSTTPQSDAAVDANGNPITTNVTNEDASTTNVPAATDTSAQPQPASH